jgi:hypothetical protein
VTTPERCGQDLKRVAEPARLIAASDCAPGSDQIIYARLARHADRERRGLPHVSHSALGTAGMLVWKWLKPYML